MSSTPLSTTLEILSAEPAQRRLPHPVLFVHGAFGGAWLWAEHFMPYFAQHGVASHAVSLSGHGNSHGREHIDLFGLDDFVADVRQAVLEIGEPCVLVGHSMGATILQRYICQWPAPALVLLSAVPPSGTLPSALQLGLFQPHLLAELNRLHRTAGRGEDPNDVQDLLLATDVPEADLRRYASLFGHESHRAIMELSWEWMHPHISPYHPPVLVAAGEADAMFPRSSHSALGLRYRTRPQLIPGAGHALMLETNWQRSAELILGWLNQQFPAVAA